MMMRLFGSRRRKAEAAAAPADAATDRAAPPPDPQTAFLAALSASLAEPPPPSPAGREEFLRGAVTKAMFGLEVGASYAPAFPSAGGYNVERLDHTDAEGLRAKYAAEGVDVGRIEEVTYVSDGRPMHEIVPRRSAYDYIFASHVIEHVTDPIAFLKSCEALLKPDGQLLLVIPDKRRCFDAFQSLSTTGQWLRAHAGRSIRHPPDRMFDFFANIGDLSGTITWNQRAVGIMNLGGTLQLAQDRFAAASAPEGTYEDIHGWYYTPSSFRLIVQDLAALGHVRLKEARFQSGDDFEFYISMRMDAAGCGIPRLQLLREIVREQIVGGVQLLANEQA